MMDLELRDRAEQEYRSRPCDHQMGLWGDYTTGQSTIQWHQHKTDSRRLGLPEGFCKKCLRTIKLGDSDYAALWNKRSPTALSTAGIRFKPTAQELEERRAWEKTCEEWRRSGREWEMD